MSKHETPLTRGYWKEIGGTLVEEFLAVKQGPGPVFITFDGVFSA